MATEPPIGRGGGESYEDWKQLRHRERHRPGCRQAAAGQGTRTLGGSRDQGASSAAAAGVPVTFSNAARGVDAAARGPAEFDAGKVKAVKAAIENGTFKVDADAVADKLLSNAEETFSRSRSRN